MMMSELAWIAKSCPTLSGTKLIIIARKSLLKRKTKVKHRDESLSVLMFRYKEPYLRLKSSDFSLLLLLIS